MVLTDRNMRFVTEHEVHGFSADEIADLHDVTSARVRQAWKGFRRRTDSPSRRSSLAEPRASSSAAIGQVMTYFFALARSCDTSAGCTLG